MYQKGLNAKGENQFQIWSAAARRRFRIRRLDAHFIIEWTPRLKAMIGQYLISTQRKSGVKPPRTKAASSRRTPNLTTPNQTAITSISGSTSCLSIPSIAIKVPVSELGQLPHAPW
jgi:hypothetical protein